MIHENLKQGGILFDQIPRGDPPKYPPPPSQDILKSLFTSWWVVVEITLRTSNDCYWNIFLKEEKTQKLLSLLKKTIKNKEKKKKLFAVAFPRKMVFTILIIFSILITFSETSLSVGDIQIAAFRLSSRNNKESGKKYILQESAIQTRAKQKLQFVY